MTGAQPLRRHREDQSPDLAICTVCGKTWREAEDCPTPKDCCFTREHNRIDHEKGTIR